MFSLDDLFLVGIALDMVGAWLLARGLIRRVSVVARELETQTVVGDTARALERWAKDRVDAELGIASLLAGFGFQALGYLLVIWRGSSPSRGACEAAVALALAIAAALTLVLIHRLTRTRRTMKLLRETVLRQRIWQKASLVTHLAQALGHSALPNEPNRAWAERVFRLSLPYDPTEDDGVASEPREPE